MTETKDSSEGLRRLMDEMVLGLQDGYQVSVDSFFNGLKTQCKRKGIRLDGRAALEYWWHLARLGVVAVPGDTFSGSSTSERRRLVLTDRGRELLERGENSPHDPRKYLDAVRNRVANPDDIVLTYLDEAVGAWAAGLYRASAVMLGCACERLVLILAERIAAGSFQPWTGRIKKELAGAPSGISRVFAHVLECLISLRGKKKLPGKLADALDRRLSAIFDHARGLRNRSGHPTGADVSSEEAEAGLLLFPGFYVLVDGLCAHLASLP